MKKRNIDKVRFLIKDATGLDVMYAYEDLVFPDHGAFIICFDDENEHNFFCYFHEDCLEAERKDLSKKLEKTCALNKCTLVPKGTYQYEQKGEEIDIKFSLHQN